MTTMLDARRNFLQLSYENLLAEGYLFLWRDTDNIAKNDSNTYSFLTHADYPVVIKDFNIVVKGTKDLTVEIYVGGALSGGYLVPLTRRNYYRARPSPYVDDEVYGGRNVDTAGTLLYQYDIGDKDKGEISLDGNYLIMNKDTQIYITVTNNENDADIIPSILAAILT